MSNITEKAALLVMDVQPGIIDRISNKDEYLSKITLAIDAAHKYNLLVIFVVVGFRSGFPEISSRNKSFSAIRDSLSTHFINPKPVLNLKENDIIVTKRRISAFSGSDLEVVLRGNNISHLVLTGISTSGVVLSTVREAADKDYRLTVLSDLCADVDSEVHNVLTEKVFPRQATVTDSNCWINSL